MNDNATGNVTMNFTPVPSRLLCSSRRGGMLAAWGLRRRRVSLAASALGKPVQSN